MKFKYIFFPLLFLVLQFLTYQNSSLQNKKTLYSESLSKYQLCDHKFVKILLYETFYRYVRTLPKFYKTAK